MRSTLAFATTLGLLGGALVAAAPAAADDPVLHHVRYTVTADAPFWAHIYYRDTQPAIFSDYSHNPYVFSPKAEVEVGPGAPWVLTVQLADPDRWAMVSATSGRGPATPAFHCELAVDGVVVATGDGPKGALCAVRHW